MTGQMLRIRNWQKPGNEVSVCFDSEGKGLSSYSAALIRIAVVIALSTAVLAVFVSAFAAQVVTNNLNRVVKFLESCWLVLKDGQPGRAILVANAKVERCEISRRFVRAAPLASVLY